MYIWQAQRDLNPRRVALETTALPLSYGPRDDVYHALSVTYRDLLSKSKKTQENHQDERNLLAYIIKKYTLEGGFCFFIYGIYDQSQRVSSAPTQVSTMSQRQVSRDRPTTL